MGQVLIWAVMVLVCVLMHMFINCCNNRYCRNATRTAVIINRICEMIVIGMKRALCFLINILNLSNKHFNLLDLSLLF